MLRTALLASALAVAALATAQKPKVPASLEEEHKEIHAQLIAATKLGGQTGKAARALAKVLDPHFEREQQIALPPLGALQAVAAGKEDPSHQEAARLSRQLAKELPNMLAEHKQIEKAARNLAAAARKEKRPAQVRFAHQILMHAKTEEQVTYPAAILVGKLVPER